MTENVIYDVKLIIEQMLIITTFGSFILAYVSRGPPKQAPQLGLAGTSQPASSNI